MLFMEGLTVSMPRAHQRAELATRTTRDEKHEDGPFRKTRSLSELGEAMQDESVQAAYYEAEPLENEDDFLILQNIMDGGMMYIGSRTPGEGQSIQENINGYREYLRIATQDTNIRDAANRALDTIEAELAAIAAAFPGYAIYHFRDKGAKPNPEPPQRPDNFGWHADTFDIDGDMAVVRTFAGASTEYAKDPQGRGKVTPKPNAITAHRTGEAGPLHRTPSNIPNRGRFALIISLVRIPEEKGK